MKIELEQRGEYLLVRAQGRLDATWAEYFADSLLTQIRAGRHCLVIDGAQIDFLSSAGIRALMIVFKELNRVEGRLIMARPTSFVEQTLRMSGLEQWLSEGFPVDMPAADAAVCNADDDGGMQSFCLNEKARLTADTPATWLPWQRVENDRIKSLSLPAGSYALGIGSAAANLDEARTQLGEFLAVAGNVVYQPPNEQSAPDYLCAEQQFVPRMHCAQALSFQGEMAQLFRFSPTDKAPRYPLSILLEKLLVQTDGTTAGFVMLSEIEGLIGTTLIRSPGGLSESREIPFPEIRDWLSFCGERSYAHQQVLLTGIVSRTSSPLLPPLPGHSNLAAHIHAAVFPYQPLANGQLELETAVAKFFNGPPPLAVMHLTADNRPVVGLGESTLLRGACWFGPLQNPEVLS